MWGEPARPTDPSELITAVYAALRTRDYDTLKTLCHQDFVFSCNVHPVKLDCAVHNVGADKIREFLELVKQNWEVLSNKPGAPKPQVLEQRHPQEQGYVYNVTVKIHMRNRLSGLEFAGSKRQEWLIQDGRVSAMSEFLDIQQIDAMKLQHVFA